MERYEGPGEVQLDNSTLAEATSLSVSNNSGNTDVVTMKKGLAGFSKGAPGAEIQVSNAVPKAGMEADFVEKCVAGTFVKVTHLLAGKRYTYSGWIQDTSSEQGVDSTASMSFTVRAGPPVIT